MLKNMQPYEPSCFKHLGFWLRALVTPLRVHLHPGLSFAPWAALSQGDFSHIAK